MLFSYRYTAQIDDIVRDNAQGHENMGGILGTDRAADDIHDFLNWLKRVINEYHKNISPEKLNDLLSKIQDLLQKHGSILKALSDILNILKIALFAAAACFTVTSIGSIFYVALSIGENFQSCFDKALSMTPDLYDALVAAGATVAMWIPGLSGWGAAAGSVIVSTPAGAIATVPLAIGVTAYAGWHIGRRKISQRQRQTVHVIT